MGGPGSVAKPRGQAARTRAAAAVRETKGGATRGCRRPFLRSGDRRYGMTRLDRIISASSWSVMWQCHTYGPFVTGSKQSGLVATYPLPMPG